jgi:hypothetical protein
MSYELATLSYMHSQWIGIDKYGSMHKLVFSNHTDKTETVLWDKFNETPDYHAELVRLSSDGWRVIQSGGHGDMYFGGWSAFLQREVVGEK